jgi:uncharacterized integral membrane protein
VDEGASPAEEAAHHPDRLAEASRPRRERSRAARQLVALALIAALGVLGAENAQPVQVWVFGPTYRVRLVVMVVGAFVAGAVFATVVSWSRRRPRARRRQGAPRR